MRSEILVFEPVTMDGVALASEIRQAFEVCIEETPDNDELYARIAAAFDKAQRDLAEEGSETAQLVAAALGTFSLPLVHKETDKKEPA